MRARRAGFLHPAYRAAFTKTGIIESFASGFQVILTTEVYEEQVTAGLKRNLADAKQMKKFVSDGMITVAKKGEITIWQMTLILLYLMMRHSSRYLMPMGSLLFPWPV